MSFENGVFIPINASARPQSDAEAGGHRSGIQSDRTSISTTHQTYYQKPRGNSRYQLRRGHNRNDGGLHQKPSNDVVMNSLMQIPGLLTTTDVHSNSVYGDFNPEAPDFHPRNFQVDPTNYNLDSHSGTSPRSRSKQHQRLLESSRKSRGATAAPRHHQNFQGYSSGKNGFPNAFDEQLPLEHRKDISKERRGNQQVNTLDHSGNDSEAQSGILGSFSQQQHQQSPRHRKHPHQLDGNWPIRFDSIRNISVARASSNGDDIISDGYSDTVSEPQYQRSQKNTSVSRSTTRDKNDYYSRPSASNHRQYSRSNNWRSEHDSTGENIERWDGEDLGNRKYSDREPTGYEVKVSTAHAIEENGQEGKFFERAQALWKEKQLDKNKKPDPRNQRETMTEQLSRNSYDCMICVEKVRRSQPIWSCQKCYNVFHLNCLRKWASSSADEVGWRCPGCQTYNEIIPSEYMCFCGSMKNPQNIRSDAPHSCGQTCGRHGIGGLHCIHSCTIQCHPGPCPPCEALLNRSCCCGKTSAQVKCSSKSVMTCGAACDKLLNCGIHKCSRPCHGGPCDPCSVVIKLVCHCGLRPSEVLCTEETVSKKNYSCGKICTKSLNCKKHSCEEDCHPGLCKPCKMSPEAVLSCPCGQTSITEVCLKKKLRNRTSCTDPIPTCGKTCRKILPCGEPGDNHICQEECHLEPQCPSCPLVTPVKCRCGNKKFDIQCKNFKASDDAFCEKKCTKKRNCGRHKCNTKCCIDHDHICPIVCERSLRCGNHNCSLLCHNGHCPACRTVSFDELACECGASVIYPPVPCGTKPPQCHQPCPRTHDCDHPVLHTCHSDQTCPPCTVLMPKWCNGNHDLRKNVMCHIKQVSCGMPCHKLLGCGRHKCVRFCHPGECHVEDEICKLPCESRRKDCGHHCGAPCHDGPCPDSKCKLTTDVTCDCGRKKETMVCWKREKEYDRLVYYLSSIELKRLAERKLDEENEISPGNDQVKDENGYLRSIKNKTPKTNVLECDKECARIERNRKMVTALQLEDPDVTSTFGTPNYTDFLIGFAKKNPQFVEMVHQRLTSLVLKARKSKRKNETYEFESMNRDKRQFVHEYSDHFGCLSESFDEEPNRNVICTASKEKSYCPSVNLIDAVFRPNLKSERKNAYDDVEVFQTSKSQIMRPANGKIMLPSRGAGSGMVALSGPNASCWHPIGDFPPLS